MKLVVHDLMIVSKVTHQPLVNKVSFTVEAGETLGIVGESGSGKSLICKALMGLLPSWLDATGSICYAGQEYMEASYRRWHALRGKKVAVVLQEAMNAFDPLHPIGKHMIESVHHKVRQEVTLWLETVGLHETHKISQSHVAQLSGGQLQRVMLAIALAQGCPLLIADEPTASLDTVSQQGIIALLKEIQQCQKSMIFVSHDLSLVQQLADKILVIKEGEGVEYGDSTSLLRSPQHAYTRSLIHSRRHLSKRFVQCFA